MCLVTMFVRLFLPLLLFSLPLLSGSQEAGQTKANWTGRVERLHTTVFQWQKIVAGNSERDAIPLGRSKSKEEATHRQTRCLMPFFRSLVLPPLGVQTEGNLRVIAPTNGENTASCAQDVFGDADTHFPATLGSRTKSPGHDHTQGSDNNSHYRSPRALCASPAILRNVAS